MLEPAGVESSVAEPSVASLYRRVSSGVNALVPCSRRRSKVLVEVVGDRCATGCAPTHPVLPVSRFDRSYLRRGGGVIRTLCRGR